MEPADGTITLSSPTGGYGTYSIFNQRWSHLAGFRNFFRSCTGFI